MKRLYILAIIIFFSFLFMVFWWKRGTSPANASDKTHKIFLIKPGTAFREIANNLKEEGLVKDPVVFFLLVKQLGLDQKIQAGDFRLSPSQNAQEIAEALTHGTLDIWVTIPEGKRALEVAEILKEKIPTYEDSWKTELVKYEGYLFPDTYLIPKDASINLVISLLTNTFEKKYDTIDGPGKKEFTKNEIVTIASMVEREAKYPQDRPLVASVIVNRLAIHMPLQIDATIQYALGYDKSKKTWWKKSLTIEDLKIDSLYNTYIRTGIPPTPISNPGISVLEAVAKPVKTDYLYYVSDSSGKNHYAETFEEHNTNIKKYGL